MRKAALAITASLVILAACGGSGIEMKNGLNVPIREVTLSVGDQESSWERIDPGETVRSSVGLSPESTISVSFVHTGGRRTETVTLPQDREDSPKAVWIGLYRDRISLEYAY